MDYRGVRYTIGAGIEPNLWSISIYPGGVESRANRIYGPRKDACGFATAARAQPATTLTLACKGTMTEPRIDEKPEAISMGLIVNFADRTVQGFGRFLAPGLDIPVKITAANDTTIAFEGHTFSRAALFSLSFVKKSRSELT
jgi:hypothetical protein